VLFRSKAGALARFSFGGSSTTCRLACDTLVGIDGERAQTTGTLLVRIGGTTNQLRLGDRVRLIGNASALRPPMNPGAFDGPRWGAENNIGGRIFLDSDELITPIEHKHANPITHLLARADAWLTGRTHAWLGSTNTSPERALIAAMLLGDRSDELAETEQTFRRIGLAHVLAISGLHLSAMVYLSLLALRLTGDRPRLHALLLVLALGAYLLLVPARTPIVRAAILSLAIIASELAGRRYDRLTLLGWVMIAVLIWKPTEIFSAGFHLSFGVVEIGRASCRERV